MPFGLSVIHNITVYKILTSTRRRDKSATKAPFTQIRTILRTDKNFHCSTLRSHGTGGTGRIFWTAKCASLGPEKRSQLFYRHGSTLRTDSSTVEGFVEACCRLGGICSCRYQGTFPTTFWLCLRTCSSLFPSQLLRLLFWLCSLKLHAKTRLLLWSSCAFTIYSNHMRTHRLNKTCLEWSAMLSWCVLRYPVSTWHLFYLLHKVFVYHHVWFAAYFT